MRLGTSAGIRVMVFGFFALAALSCSAVPSFGQQRKLAPGVMKTILAEPQEAETFTGPREFLTLVNAAHEWQPNFGPAGDTLAEMARATTFRRTIWQLEFSFKPVRMLQTADGKLIWYLLYKVRNNGGHFKPTAKEDQTGNTIYEIARVGFPVRFYPVFILVGHDYKQTYTDRIVPSVVQQIHAAEIRDPNVPLRGSVEIGAQPLSLSSDGIDRGVWGVAMWENVDPRTDFFSVYVKGLSNAYRWEAKQDDAASRLSFKTLQLNFWRPGDTVREQDDHIRYGMPKVSDPAKETRLLELYDLDEPRDYVWVYRP